MIMEFVNCARCRFAVMEPSSNLGRCRRNAPVADMSHKERLPVWPLIWPEGWCGEFVEGNHVKDNSDEGINLGIRNL